MFIVCFHIFNCALLFLKKTLVKAKCEHAKIQQETLEDTSKLNSAFRPFRVGK